MRVRGRRFIGFIDDEDVANAVTPGQTQGKEGNEMRATGVQARADDLTAKQRDAEAKEAALEVVCRDSVEDIYRF